MGKVRRFHFKRNVEIFFEEYKAINRIMSEDFYLRYYVGHKGKFGHEFLEFEFRPDGKLRYANNSNYKNDTMIRKEAYVHKSVMDELRRVIEDSEIMEEDDTPWPQPDRVGRQELEIVIGTSTFPSPPRKLALWLTSTTARILMVSVVSIILFKT